jgi:hypothetical protein
LHYHSSAKVKTNKNLWENPNKVMQEEVIDQLKAANNGVEDDEEERGGGEGGGGNLRFF